MMNYGWCILRALIKSDQEGILQVRLSHNHLWECDYSSCMLADWMQASNSLLTLTNQSRSSHSELSTLPPNYVSIATITHTNQWMYLYHILICPSIYTYHVLYSSLIMYQQKAKCIMRKQVWKKAKSAKVERREPCFFNVITLIHIPLLVQRDDISGSGLLQWLALPDNIFGTVL